MFNTIQDMFDSSESSSSDDEIVEMCVETDEEIQMLSALIKDKRNSIKDYMETVFPIYSESEFKMHFRISRSLFDALCSKFEESAIFLNLRKDKRLSAREHLAVFLWFAGHEGTSFRDLSDRFNISTSTVSIIIDRVCNFLSNMSPDIIKWPNEEQKVTSSTAFKNKCGFSKVIGCIDGTHITIDPPLNLKNQYIDRKGNVSICMQGICNEKKKFISIFVGYPGSSHDSWIYQNSPIFNRINSYCGDYYLLGDSAYPCSKHLFCKSFNRTYIWHFETTFSTALLLQVKRACCVLHNIASENDLDFIYENSETNSHEVVILPQEEHITGNAFRQLICSEIQ
ncbi:Protein ALP1-like [Lucilia cuprina]|nr:Protein ALP1-like [Lucilia cuprina]